MGKAKPELTIPTAPIGPPASSRGVQTYILTPLLSLVYNVCHVHYNAPVDVHHG